MHVLLSLTASCYEGSQFCPSFAAYEVIKHVSMQKWVLSRMQKNQHFKVNMELNIRRINIHCVYFKQWNTRLAKDLDTVPDAKIALLAKSPRS